jgi:glycosyltransferase involved in cell wall biosynthesis
MKKVAIITRTKDRPIMLPRVLESVANQSFTNFVWVIVNDNGEVASVDEVAEKAISKGVDTFVIHRRESVGMEAASNDGIQRSESEYIVIHDDDDTWDPEFLQETVSYLNKTSDAVGVVSWANRVDEVVGEDTVTITGTTPYNHWLQNIYISDLAIVNRFPPISFLFRREIWVSVGGFDESLPVLGDWDFHLKAALEGDIHVIPSALANYHFRPAIVDKDSVYGNTVTSGIDKHIMYDAVYRNRKLRDDINSGNTGMGNLLALGQMLRRVNNLSDAVGRISQMSRSSRLLSAIRRLFRI